MSKIVEKPRQTAKIHFSDSSSTREYAIYIDNSASAWDQFVTYTTGDLVDYLGATWRSTSDNNLANVPQAGSAAWQLFGDRDAALAMLMGLDEWNVDTVGGVDRFRESAEIKEFDQGGGCWNATINYSKNPNQIEMTFDIGVGNTKVQQAKETIRAYDCVAGTVDDYTTIPNFQGAINVTDNGVDGVDVEIGKVEFQVSKKWKASILAGDYIARLAMMTPSVNNAEFTITWNPSAVGAGNGFTAQTLTFAKGTLKFKGVRIKQDSDDNLDITYQFAYSKSLLTDDVVTIGGSANLSKEGWEYLWVYYKDSTDASNRRVKKPIAAYVVRVYDYANFDDLELGL